MHFAQDQTAGVNLIRSYMQGELQVNDTVTRRPLIVAARYLLLLDDNLTVHDIGTPHADLLKAQQPEVVLIGSGIRQNFPRREFMNEFLRANLGIEVMGTPAACRTYNVLISEHRAAVALLIP